MVDVVVGEAGWRDAAYAEQKGKGCAVFFYDKQVGGSKITYIKILIPGDATFNIDRKATENDFIKYAVQYTRYQQKKSQQPDGMPIELAPFLGEQQILQLKAFHITTIEQFVNLAEQNTKGIMGYSDLRKKAVAFLNAEQNATKVEEAEQKRKAAEEELASLKARLAALEAPKRRGRRPKAEAAAQ